MAFRFQCLDSTRDRFQALTPVPRYSTETRSLWDMIDQGESCIIVFAKSIHEVNEWSNARGVISSRLRAASVLRNIRGYHTPIVIRTGRYLEMEDYEHMWHSIMCKRPPVYDDPWPDEH